MTVPSRRILIAGGGPGGLVTALALQRAGFEPLIYERSSMLAGGSGFTLWPNALHALCSLDLEDELNALTIPFEAMAMFERGGKRLFDLSGATMKNRFGYSGVAILRQRFIELVASKLDPACLHFGTTCVGFRQDSTGCTLLLEDGSEIRGAGLIGANGLNSFIRNQLWKTPPPRLASYSVFRGVSTIALDEQIAATSMGRGMQFGFFPMAQGQVYWFASTNTRQSRDLSQKFFLEAVREQFQPWHSPVSDILAHANPEGVLWNEVFDLDPLPQWSLGRVTLLGDAAHPATPDLGQGLCQSIEDAVVLAHCLSSTADLPTAFLRYEELRKPRTRSITLQSRSIGQSGSWTNPIACYLRNLAFSLIPANVQLKQLEELFHFEFDSKPAMA
jgi:2-polyprenyl-6-methoxyphenol hydroxylase-like FAD-dependent oxidoreductase